MSGLSQAAAIDSALLEAAGLNLLAVFNVADLPPAIVDSLGSAAPYRQLILVGHAGKALWEAVQASGMGGADPIDTFSVRTVAAWLERQAPGIRRQQVYPGNQYIGLQALGELAGWHHPSPFMLGINTSWGSWFAYRVAVLADTHFQTTLPLSGGSPCPSCTSRACLAACPAGALNGNEFALGKCIAWRKRSASSCRFTCLARCACPVAKQHRYLDAQLQHSYAISLRMIEQFGELGAR